MSIYLSCEDFIAKNIIRIMIYIFYLSFEENMLWVLIRRKAYVVDTHQKHLIESLQLSTQNILFFVK